MLRHSETLEGLKDAEEISVWKKHESGIMSIHIWAPELHYLRGEWYLYYAGGDKDDVWAIRPYVLRCTGQDPLHDPWVEMGMLERVDAFCFNEVSLDMTVFEHRDRMYVIWAEKANIGKTYHARPYDEIVGDPLYDINRHTYLMDVPMEDGKPVFRYENNRINQ